jgi:probable HAF family extracellular repeat protein
MQIVGSANTAGNNAHACLFTLGTRFDLGTMNELTSIASSINDAGQIVGAAGLYRAFIYEHGAMRDLGDLGYGGTAASAIGRNGHIVGSSAVNGATHAFSSTGGPLVDLLTLGGKNSYGRGVNGLGHMVGESDPSTGVYKHAFLYKGGSMTDLGAVGNRSSYALSINDAGAIVGFAGVFGGIYHGFVRLDGVNYDLNGMLDSQSSAWEIWYARDINEGGQIVGEARHYAGYTHAVLLTPDNLIAGIIHLQGLLGSPAGRIASFTLYRSDGSIYQSWSEPMTSGGYFYHTLPSYVGAGTLTLKVKVENWLAAKTQFTYATSTSISLSPLNGDIDRDNEVSILDYLILSEYYGVDEDSPNWNTVGANGFRPRDADLDGDGTTSILDYLLLSQNYGVVGD